MATSEAEICNLALARLGQGEFITSLDQANKAAEVCKLYYPTTRDALLRQHKWNFATKRQTLALASTPNWKYTYAFQLPNDCLKVIETENDKYVDSKWDVEEDKIVTNDSSCKIEYIARVTDVSKFDSLFVDLVACRLAAEISPHLTKNSALTERLWKIYEAKIAEARTMDGQEGGPETYDDDTWLASRY